jgi:hypothetical protein
MLNKYVKSAVIEYIFIFDMHLTESGLTWYTLSTRYTLSVERGADLGVGP